MDPSHHFCTRCGAANQAQDAFCFACGHPLQAIPASPQYSLAGSAISTTTGLLTPHLMLHQRYRILEPAGKGGFGAVYKAEDVQLGNRLLAVKEMSQSGLSPQEIAEATENFKREALLLAALKHPNLPRIYDHFNEAGRWYLVMDFIDGENLEAYLQKQPEGHLSVKETLQLGIQLCTVLSYLHSHQPPIIYRDLKPANIMRTPEGNLYLIDFGIARHFKPGQKRDTIAFGSSGYAAPEQYGKAQTTARSDIYSLGATLHHLLTGVDPSDTPFQFAPLQLHGQPTPPGLKQLLMQMVDMNESKRPASMIEVKQKLQGINTRKASGKKNIAQPGSVAQPISPAGSSLHQAQTSPPNSPQQTGTPKVAGDLYLKAKRYQEALEAFEHALQLDPDNAYLYNGKGRALSGLKRYREALPAFERAIQLEPTNVTFYNRKGVVLHRLERSQEALAALEQAIRLDPNYAPSYDNKGDTLSGLKRYQEALAAYQLAIHYDPNNALYYNDKGLALYRLERHNEALIAFEHAIRLDPNYAPAYDHKGDTLSRLKRYQEALTAYEHAIRLDPNNALYHNDKGLALDDLKRYQGALEAFEHAVALNPSFVNACYNKGMMLFNLKRYKEALVALDQVIQLDPKKSLFFYNKGLTLEKLGRDEEAIQAYDRAIQLDPTYKTAFENRGNTLGRLGRYEEAIVTYNRAIQLDPKNSLVYYNKGYTLGKLERYEEAIAACDQALQLDPTFSLAFNNKGYSLERLGRYEEALELYKMAEKLDPANTLAKSNREKLEKLMKQKKGQGFFHRFVGD